MGIYTLERVGIGHDAKEEVRLAAARCSVEDFFGVTAEAFRAPPLTTPAIKAPLPTPLPLSHGELSNALTYSYFAGKIGIDIKVKLPTVLALLPLYRPYTQFADLRKEDVDQFNAYTDQMTMLFNLIHVCVKYMCGRNVSVCMCAIYPYMRCMYLFHCNCYCPMLVLLSGLVQLWRIAAQPITVTS